VFLFVALGVAACGAPAGAVRAPGASRQGQWFNLEPGTAPPPQIESGTKTVSSSEALGDGPLRLSWRACIDATGRVDQVKMKEPTGLAADTAMPFENAVHGWTVTPLRIGGTAIPACMPVVFDRRAAREAFVASFDEPWQVAGETFSGGELTAGLYDVHLSIQVLMHLPKGTYTVIAKYCVDETGAVTVTPRDSPVSTQNREVEGYVRARMAEWRFSPFLLGGRPVAVCSRRMFRYVIER